MISLHQVSPPKPCIRLSTPSIRATCSAHHIILDFITRTIFGEQYRSLSSSLCSFPHSPVTSSLLGSNIPPNTPVLKHSQPVFIPQCQRPSFTSIQNNRQNYSSAYLNSSLSHHTLMKQITALRKCSSGFGPWVKNPQTTVKYVKSILKGEGKRKIKGKCKGKDQRVPGG